MSAVSSNRPQFNAGGVRWCQVFCVNAAPIATESVRVLSIDKGACGLSLRAMIGEGNMSDNSVDTRIPPRHTGNCNRMGVVLPPMKMSTVAVLLMVSPGAFAACTSSGEAVPWNNQVKSVCLDERISRNSFASPDGRKILVAERNGFHVELNGQSLEMPIGANDSFYPSDIAWSPRSDRFFVNNGDGSGTDGWTLRAFPISSSEVLAEPDFNKLIVTAFRRSLGCPADRVHPNVRGQGMARSCLPSRSLQFINPVAFKAIFEVRH